MTDVVSPETIRWLAGGAATCIVLVGGAVASLLALAVKLGRAAQRIEHIGAQMLEVKERADEVPALKTKVGVLEEAWRESRQEFRDMRRAVFGRSSPDFSNGAGHDGEE